MRNNVFLDKESEKQNVQLQLTGDIAPDYASNYNPGKLAHSNLEVSKALNDAAFTMTGDILNLYEDNKVNQLDADIRATWHDVEMEVMSDPTRFYTKDGLEEIATIRNEYKELMDDEIIDRTLNGKNQLEFLTANEEKNRALELDLQRKTIEQRMQRELQNATNIQEATKESLILSINKNSDPLNTEGVISNFKLDSDSNGIFKKNISSVIKTGNLTGNPYQLDGTLPDIIDYTFNGLVSNEIDLINRSFAEGTELTSLDLNKQIDALTKKVETSGDFYDEMLNEAYKIAKLEGETLNKERKEQIKLNLDNRLIKSQQNLYPQLIELQNNINEKNGLALNELQAYEINNPAIYDYEATKQINEAGTSYAKGNPLEAYEQFYKNPYGKRDVKTDSLMYYNKDSENRLLLMDREKADFAERKIRAINAGDKKALVNAYSDYNKQKKEYIKSNGGSGRSDYLLGTDFDATFHERNEGVQTGLNLSINNLNSAILKNKLKDVEAYVSIGDAQGIQTTTYDNLEFNTLNYDAKKELSDWGIYTEDDLKLFAKMSELEIIGKRREAVTFGQDPTTIEMPFDFTNSDASAYSILEYIKNNTEKVFLVNKKNNTLDPNINILDIFTTTENFEPAQINWKNANNNNKNNQAVTKLYKKSPTLFIGPVGQTVIQRGFIESPEEYKEFVDEIESKKIMDYYNINDDLKNAMLESIKIGIMTEEEKSANVETNKNKNSETNGNFVNNQDSLVKNTLLEEVYALGFNEEDTKKAIEIIESNDFSRNALTYPATKSEREALTDRILNNIAIKVTDDEVNALPDEEIEEIEIDEQEEEEEPKLDGRTKEGKEQAQRQKEQIEKLKSKNEQLKEKDDSRYAGTNRDSSTENVETKTYRDKKVVKPPKEKDYINLINPKDNAQYRDVLAMLDENNDLKINNEVSGEMFMGKMKYHAIDVAGNAIFAYVIGKVALAAGAAGSKFAIGKTAAKATTVSETIKRKSGKIKDLTDKLPKPNFNSTIDATTGGVSPVTFDFTSETQAAQELARKLAIKNEGATLEAIKKLTGTIKTDNMKLQWMKNLESSLTYNKKGIATAIVGAGTGVDYLTSNGFLSNETENQISNVTKHPKNIVDIAFNWTKFLTSKTKANVVWAASYKNIDDDSGNMLFDYILTAKMKGKDYTKNLDTHRSIGSSDEYDVKTYSDAKNYLNENLHDFQKRGYSNEAVYNKIMHDSGSFDVKNKLTMTRDQAITSIGKIEGLTGAEIREIIILINASKTKY